MWNWRKRPFQRCLSFNLPPPLWCFVKQFMLHNMPWTSRGGFTDFHSFSTYDSLRFYISIFFFSSPVTNNWHITRLILPLKCCNSAKCRKPISSEGQPWWPVQSSFFGALELIKSVAELSVSPVGGSSRQGRGDAEASSPASLLRHGPLWVNPLHW